MHSFLRIQFDGYNIESNGPIIVVFFHKSLCCGEYQAFLLAVYRDLSLSIIDPVPAFDLNKDQNGIMKGYYVYLGAAITPVSRNYAVISAYEILAGIILRSNSDLSCVQF